MFEELIEKIWALKKQKRLYGYGHISVRKHGYNEGIKDAMKVIKQAIPQPQDKPDSEGWWWIMDGRELQPVYIDESLEFFYTGNRDDYLGEPIPEKVCYYNGKWYKAIVPEVTK